VRLLPLGVYALISIVLEIVCQSWRVFKREKSKSEPEASEESESVPMKPSSSQPSSEHHDQQKDE
jgi:hypothetical protein